MRPYHEKKNSSQKKGAGGLARVVEHLTSKPEAQFCQKKKKSYKGKVDMLIFQFFPKGSQNRDPHSYKVITDYSLNQEKQPAMWKGHYCSLSHCPGCV
jgi:hypothetical protein